MTCEKDVGMGLCTFNFVLRLSLHLVCLLFGTSSLHLLNFFLLTCVLMAGRWSVLYIAFEFSFIVMKMIWCRGSSRSKMQFFRAKMTVIA